MQVQLHTDRNVEGHERLALHVEGVVQASLGRFADRITRVEVHLGDENGAKSGGDDKRCMIEARVAHRRPSAVTHHAASLEEALNGATEKMQRLLDATFGRIDARRE